MLGEAIVRACIGLLGGVMGALLVHYCIYRLRVKAEKAAWADLTRMRQEAKDRAQRTEKKDLDES